MTTTQYPLVASVCALCPEMRVGQLVATIGMLAEDETGRNLWDIEGFFTEFSGAPR